MITEPLLYSPEAAARLLGVSRANLYKIMSAGQLPSVKIGTSRRIRREALDAYIDALPAA